MRLKGRMTTVAISAAVMAMSGMLIVGATEVTTRKESENKTTILKETNSTEVIMNEVAEIIPAAKDIVRAAEESETEAVVENDRTESVDTADNKVEESEKEEKTESAFAGKFMVNVDEYLNIRAAADENSDVVGKLYAGAGGTVIEKGIEWTKISSGSVEGYVATKYILFDADAEAKANEVGIWKVTILEDSIRVRKLPSTEAGVWGLVEKNDEYRCTKITDDWLEINYDGEIGYVSTDYSSVRLVVGEAVSIEEELEQIRKAEEEKAAKEAEAKRKEEEARAEEKKIAAASKFVETVQTSSYNVSEEDVYLLACLVCAEAGYEPYEGKLAVANVVLNRLNGGLYGNTMSDVIYARGQFSVAASGRLAKIMAAGPNNESITAAKEALSGKNNVPEYSNFRSCGGASYGNYNNYTIIGNQVFYN